MTIETGTITLPVYWASALINGDTSGMDDDEIASMDNYIQDACFNEGWRVVDCVEDTERFTWSFNLYGGDCAGGDVCDYTILRDKA